MPSIILQTFGDGDDKALQLENEEWGRLLSIGSDWARLRLGIMCNIIPNGTNNITTASLRLGFSAAANSHFGSQSSGLWYGGVLGPNPVGYGGGTLTYNANSGNPFFGGSAMVGSAVRVVNGAITHNDNFRAIGIPTNTGSITRRGVAVVELEKSGTSMKVNGRMTSNNATVMATNYTLADFRTMMANTAILSAGTALPLAGTNLSPFTTNDTYANHDVNAATYGEPVAAHVGWNIGLTNFLNIFAIEVFRHA